MTRREVSFLCAIMSALSLDMPMSVVAEERQLYMLGEANESS